MAEEQPADYWSAYTVYEVVASTEFSEVVFTGVCMFGMKVSGLLGRVKVQRG
jgi:hypothetical protein